MLLIVNGMMFGLLLWSKPMLMITLEINTLINPGKLTEFTQTKESLLIKMKAFKGVSVISTEKEANHFQIKILLSDANKTDDIINSQWYNYLRGAIEVLGQNTSYEIKEINN